MMCSLAARCSSTLDSRNIAGQSRPAVAGFSEMCGPMASEDVGLMSLSSVRLLVDDPWLAHRIAEPVQAQVCLAKFVSGAKQKIN